MTPRAILLLLLLALCGAAPAFAATAASEKTATAPAPAGKPDGSAVPDDATGEDDHAGEDDDADDDTDADEDDDGQDTATDPSSPCPQKKRTCWPEDIAREQQRLDALPAPDGSELADRLGDAVHDAPEFGGMAYDANWRHWEWRFQPNRHREETSDNGPSWLRAIGDFLRALSRAFGTLGHVVLWSLLLLLLVLLWRHRDDLLGTLARRGGERRIVAGVDIAPLLSPDALPDDVLAGADRLWQAGHPREALSLLYRAALHRLGARLAFAVPESGTEAECLALVERHADRDTAASFRVLVNAWMRMAWQDRAPADLAPLRSAWRRAVGLPPTEAGAEFAGGAA